MRQTSSAILLVVLVLQIAGTMGSVSAATVDLPKTGQTLCSNEAGATIPCSGTGQDGEIQAGIAWPDPRFTDNGDGSLTDKLTGLVWLKDSDCFGSVKWIDALTAVNGLGNGSCGLSDGSSPGDWRLPNIVELISPANMGAADSLGWLTGFGFTGLTAHGRWSSSSVEPLGSNAFIYQFRDQFIGIGTKGSTYKVWAVRGTATGPAKLWKTGQTVCYDHVGTPIDCVGTGQDGEIQAGTPWPDPRFTDHGNGSVTDNLTGLIWLEDADCFGARFWLDALSDARTLQDGACSLTDGSSAGEWRLPNPWEITSLVDFSRYGPALPPDQPFTNTSTSAHWTSTSVPIVRLYAYWGLPSGYGNYQFSLKNSMYHVWPVRGGGVVVPPLFSDGFESGDTSAWSSSVP